MEIIVSLNKAWSNDGQSANKTIASSSIVVGHVRKTTGLVFI